jgi:hypothetical protein
MGTMGMIVYCECAVRGPLPHDSWGAEQTEDGYLSDRQRRVFRRWDDVAEDPVCSHEEGASFVVRGRAAYDALEWAMALETAGNCHVAPILSRLKTPNGGFVGDLIVIPDYQALEINNELDQLGADALVPENQDAELSPVHAWRAAVAAARRACQPILIGYGM